MRNLTNITLAVVMLAFVAFTAIGATTATPERTNFIGGVTAYFDLSTFTYGNESGAVETLAWSSDRNFTDTTQFDVYAFASGGTATGPLRMEFVDDSTVAVFSAAADSATTYWYTIWLVPR